MSELTLTAGLSKQVLWLIFVLAWGVLKLVSLRLDSINALSEEGGLDTWSLGQTIAVALLAAPLFSLLARAIDGYGGERDLRNANSMAEDSELPPTVVTQTGETPQHLQDIELDSLIGIPTSDSSSTSQDIHLRQISGAMYRRLCARQAFARSGDTTRTWLSICRTVSCLYWLVLGSVAMVSTNVPLRRVAPSNQARSPSYSLLEFWITGPGLVWWTITWYPATSGLSIALGLHLEHYYLDRQGGLKIQRHALGFFTCLLLLQVVCGVLWPMVVEIDAVPSSLLAVSTSLALYLLYAFVCVCVRLCGRRSKQPGTPI